jgi:cobalamin biosynthesis protein CbiD
MKWQVTALIVSIGLLSGCGNSATETIYQHLEKAVELEEPFVSQQQSLQEAEEKEYQLYEKMIALGTEEMDELSNLSDQALESVSEREQLMESEKESVEQSKEEFDQIQSAISDLDREDLQDLVNQLEEEMNARYSSYGELYDHYIAAIEEDRKLFTIIKDEELTMDSLQEQIDQVNQQYDLVHEKKEVFNQHTQSYNKLKRSFYEEAELDVHYEE